MARLPLVLATLVAFLVAPLPAADPTPKEVVGPVVKSKLRKGKMKAKISQRTAVKSRKRMKLSRRTPFTAKTPARVALDSAGGAAPTATAAAAAAAIAPETPGAPAPASPARLELAYFGAGCFWCLEGLYQVVPGVVQVVNGYAGGNVASPTYKQVLSGTTGHAEVVQITYDANVVSYDQLLDNFWEIHDPTQVDRQGNDVGPQYRSIILYRTEAERERAEQSKSRVQRTYRQPVATQIVALDKFWVAEDFHQDYFARHPGAPYCQLVIRPKLEKFQKNVGRK